MRVEAFLNQSYVLAVAIGRQDGWEMFVDKG